MIDKDYIDNLWNEAGYDINTCTCIGCFDNEECRYAFDLYNINGDCLASK